MRSKIFNYHKIKAGSPDKVRGKLVKYRKGDCLSLLCSNGKYLAAFISEKFNRYYDLTLLEYLKESKPTMEDFLNGRFFGNFGGDENPDVIGVEKKMIDCIEADENPDIEKVGTLDLIDHIERKFYSYVQGIDDILEHYITECPRRLINTLNFEKVSNINMIGDRLIELKKLIKIET